MPGLPSIPTVQVSTPHPHPHPHVQPANLPNTPQVAAPVTDSVAVAKDVVDVAVEEIEEDSPSIVTIQEHIDALPTPPQSLFRDPSGPPIPAGIVQATQPKFVQVLFKVT